MAPDHGLSRQGFGRVGTVSTCPLRSRLRPRPVPGSARDEVVAAAVVAVPAHEGVARAREKAGVVELDVDPVAAQGAREQLLGGGLVAVRRDRDGVHAHERLREGQRLRAERAQQPPRVAGRLAAGGLTRHGGAPRRPAGGVGSPRRRRRRAPGRRRARASSERSGGIVCGEVTLKAATSAPSSSALESGRPARLARELPAGAKGRPAASPARTPPRSASPAPAVLTTATGRAGACVQAAPSKAKAPRAPAVTTRRTPARSAGTALRAAAAGRASGAPPGRERRRAPRPRPRSAPGGRRATGSPSPAPPRSRPW